MIRLLLVGSVSGALWGTAGYWIASDTSARDVAWIGLLVSPVIGIVISFLAAGFEPDTLMGQIGFAFLGLYLAVALFGMALEVADVRSLTLDVPRRLMSAAVGAMVAITVYGAVLILWPLSIVNHLVIWSRPRS